MSGQGIFISYRREDSQGESGRLDDHLRRRYGHSQVFRDVHDSPPGVSFPEHLARTVATCQVTVVVIGARWLQALHARDQGRDWVRLEIGTALRSPGVVVIPVLVQGASMPRQEHLPPDLQPLATITALELSDSRWDYDMSRLVAFLDRHLRPVAAPIPGRSPVLQPAPAAPAARSSVGLTCGAVALVGLAIVIGLVLVVSKLDVRSLLPGSSPFGTGASSSPFGTGASSSPFGTGASASIQLSPTSGAGGASVTVSGSGFQAGETVQVFFQGQLVGQTTADGRGAFSVGVTVPQGLGVFHGDQLTVSAAGKSSVRSADAIFTIR